MGKGKVKPGQDQAETEVAKPKARGRTKAPKGESSVQMVVNQAGKETAVGDSGASGSGAGKPASARGFVAEAVENPAAPSSGGELAAAQAVPVTPPASEANAVLEEVRLPATGGKAGIFGGPKDRSAKPDDRLALPTGLHSQYERVRSLNQRGFYCSMRWDYRQRHMSTEEGKRWWANKKILVTGRASGKSVVVRAVDFGPHENTGHVIGLSPGAADAIGIQTGDEVSISFADQRAQAGPITNSAASSEQNA